MSRSLRLAKRVLLIGWDAADWKIIRPLVQRGEMPFLAELLQRGSSGNLATLQPVLSPMLWTSIATGKRPHKHGICGFTEPMPNGKGVRLSSSTTRKSKAIWNIVTQQSMTTNVIGWYCGHPAEPINGVCVSEQFQKLNLTDEGPVAREDWTLPERCVHPETFRESLASLRLHPAELTAEEILPFIPRAAEIDQAHDRRLFTFAQMFAEMVSVHNAATFAIEQNDWDFMGVYYDSIDHFGHAFMQYHPPRMDEVSEESFRTYKDVIVGCYRFHDAMLGRLIQLAGDDTTIVLCSDHGFHSDHLRPPMTPREPAGPAIWHRDHGIIVLAGPGIQRGQQIYGANLLDIAPTVLNLLGIPSARDMDGKPLLQVLDTLATPEPIESWDQVPGDAGMHPEHHQEDPFHAREAIRQLVDLGYIEEPSPNEQRAAEESAREAAYNLARAYHDGGLLDEAAEILERLCAQNPELVRFGVARLRIYVEQRRMSDARTLAEQLLTRMEHAIDDRGKQIEEAIRSIDELQDQSNDDAKLQPSNQQAHRQAMATRRRALQQRSDALRRYELRSAPVVHLLLGQLEALDGNSGLSVKYLRSVEQVEPRLPNLHLQLGQTYLRIRHHEDAVRTFARALEIDPDNAAAHEGLATALTRLRRYDEAVDHALTAVGLMHEMPRAHLRLGVTLARIGLYDQAAEAFETCLKLAPLTPAAHRWLAVLYGSYLHRPDQAYGHRMRLKAALDTLATDSA